MMVCISTTVVYVHVFYVVASKDCCIVVDLYFY